jgi:hypothetical protein
MKNLLKYYKSEASAIAAADQFKADGKGLFHPEKHGNSGKWILKQIATPEVMEQALDEATKPVVETTNEQSTETVADEPTKSPIKSKTKATKTVKAAPVKANRKFVVRVTVAGPGRGHYLMDDGKLTPWKFQAMHFDTGADAKSKADSRGTSPGETVDVVPFDNAWFEKPVNGIMTKYQSYKDAVAITA